MTWQQSAREQMVQQQVRAWDVLDPGVLDVLAQIPRERFVPDSHVSLAFADIAIPLPLGQHMLPPKVVGRILESLALTGRERVLEVGTGSGYLTACLGRLAAQVQSLEIRKLLADSARVRLADLRTAPIEIRNVDAFAANALQGEWDAIVLTGSLPRYDARFERLLAPGGRLFVVVGTSPVMTAKLVTRHASGIGTQNLFETEIDALDHAPAAVRFEF